MSVRGLAAQCSTEKALRSCCRAAAAPNINRHQTPSKDYPRTDRLSSVDVTKDANVAVTAIGHIAGTWVSDAEELRHPIFGHREYKSVGWTSDEEDRGRRLRRSVSFAVTNHRAIVYDASPTCLSARPKLGVRYSGAPRC